MQLMAGTLAAVFTVCLVTTGVAQSRFQSLRSAPEYWTSERLRDAEPAPMPQADPGLLLDQEPMVIEPQTDEPVRDEPGGLPRPDVPDLSERLHEPVPDANPLAVEDFDPFSISPIGALYTQNRVLAARHLMQLHPYRQIGRLFYRDPRTGQEFTCSASVIQLTVVATAGHCVFNAEGRYFHSNFLFVPGYVRGFAPNGRWTARGALVTREWAAGGGRVPNAADFGLLWMQGLDRRNQAICNNFAANPNCLALGEVTGWFGWRTNAVHRMHVTMLGYPGNLDGGRVPQETHAQPFQLLEPNAVIFGSGMGGGSSGGPYMGDFGRAAAGQFREPRNRLVGIMSFGNLGARLVGTSILNTAFRTMIFRLCDVGPDVCRR